MPLFNFHRKAFEIPAIARNGSTESTVDATSLAKECSARRGVSSGGNGASMWRTKEPSSILRPKTIPASDPQLDDLWTLKRCDAFDEDDN